MNPMTDEAIEHCARSCAQVERATRGYHHRLKNDDWPDWTALLPPELRELVTGDEKELHAAA